MRKDNRRVQDRIAEHTSLIEREREDALLVQIDTCQQLLSATWKFLRSADESIHYPTVKRVLLALRTVERNIDDELLEVRLQL